MASNRMIKSAIPPLKLLKKYHSYNVKGLDRVPKEGRAILAVNHSLATYDILLLYYEIYAKLGRLPRSLADRLFFRLPYFHHLVHGFGGIQGDPEGASKILNQELIIGVAPGGMREALRPSSQRYQIHWESRLGFIRLAIKQKAPIILAICPKADDIYDVYPSLITAKAYRKFRIPLFFARGLGPSLLPKPVKLTHYLSKPIQPPSCPDGADFDKVVRDFHAQVVDEAKVLISEAIADRDP